MNEKEFLLMVEYEYNKLKNERDSLSTELDFYRQTNSFGDDYQKTLYKFNLVNGKFEALKRLISLPAYERIKCMSDVETEDYKENKLEKLESDIEEIEKSKQLNEVEISQLKKEQKQLIAQFGEISGTDRDGVISKGQELSSEIRRYEEEITQMEKKIESIRNQQDFVRAMTPQGVKEELFSRIKKSLISDESIRASIDATTGLEVLLSLEQEDIRQLSKLLASYRKLSDDQKQIKVCMNLPDRIPDDFTRRLIGCYNSYIRDVTDVDRFIDVINQFEVEFETAKAFFNQHFTKEKVFGLFDELFRYGDDVDMKFLELHTDKLTNGNRRLAHLKSLVEERDNLLNKFIKKRKQIKTLKKKIEFEKSLIYRDITVWYERQNWNDRVLGFSFLYTGLFNDRSRFHTEFNMYKQAMKDTEEALTTLKTRIQEVKQQRDVIYQNYESEKQKIEEKISALCGDVDNDRLLRYASSDYSDNLDLIKDFLISLYQLGQIDRVKEEAKKLADIREAELRGITVEELLQLRQQTVLGVGDFSGRVRK